MRCLNLWHLTRVCTVCLGSNRKRLGTNKSIHDKTNKMTCVPCEDSDQPRHSPGLIRVFAVRSMVAKDTRFLHTDNEDSDQSGRMPRLILVFTGCTGHLLVLSCTGSNGYNYFPYHPLFFQQGPLGWTQQRQHYVQPLSWHTPTWLPPQWGTWAGIWPHDPLSWHHSSPVD